MGSRRRAATRGDQVSTCRSCGAQIEWVHTDTGKRMPVDANPVPDGNVIVDGDRATVVAQRPLGYDGALYTSHFSTCPDPGEWWRP